MFASMSSSRYPIHAELDGYIKLYKDKNIKFNTLLVYRGDNCDRPSQPCIGCCRLLKDISKLIIGYINTNGEFEYNDINNLIGHQRMAGKRYKSYSY